MSLTKSVRGYENLILLDGFKIERKEKQFIIMYNLKSLIKHQTFFVNAENASYIDLVLANCPRRFQKRNVSEKEVRGAAPSTVGTVSPYHILLIKMSYFIILFRIWKWVSSSILNSKFNSEAYFSHSSSFASIWCKGRKVDVFPTVGAHTQLNE